MSEKLHCEFEGCNKEAVYSFSSETILKDKEGVEHNPQLISAYCRKHANKIIDDLYNNLKEYNI